MKNLVHIAFSALLFHCVPGANAQALFTTREFIDINNIKALQAVHGDMWLDPGSQTAGCEFPQGSGRHIAIAGAIWMAGYASGGQLKAAAQTYRQSGNDYWPGPKPASSGVSYATSQDWSRIWKINRSEINTFTGIAVHTTANTPASILEWPAKGNPYAKGNNNVPLTITDHMAPFVDVNSDGLYDPLSGDYPDMKGDQMLWQVMNDDGPSAHTVTQTAPMGVQINCMVYAYKRNSGIDNVVYYEYSITNRSGGSIDSFAAGVFADMDLGNSQDDFIGFDSTRALGIIYNGTPSDNGPANQSYGDTIPMAGIRLLQVEGNACVPDLAGSFIYFNSTADPVSGKPVNGMHYNGYLRSTWKNGQPLTNDYQGPNIYSNGQGTGPATRYVFTGDPGNANTWSECNSTNTPGDRKFVISTRTLKFPADSTVKFAWALLASPREYHNGCGNADFSAIKALSDTAQAIYCDPLPPITTSVSDPRIAKKQLPVYPNPATAELHIDVPANPQEHVRISDALGRITNIPVKRNGSRITADISRLPQGVYHILYSAPSGSLSNSFIKE